MFNVCRFVLLLVRTCMFWHYKVNLNKFRMVFPGASFYDKMISVPLLSLSIETVFKTLKIKEMPKGAIFLKDRKNKKCAQF